GLDLDDDLKQVLSSAEKPIRVLGYGTNVLISDKGLPGTVVLNKTGEIKIENDQITADSGADWDELVQLAIKNGLWGLEFTSGIPGGVGAAVAGSIAAYGHRISDRFVSAEVLDIDSGDIQTWEAARFNFGYRRSDMQLPENAKYVILNATFQLSHQPTGELEYESALKAATDLGIQPDGLENRRKIILEARRRAGSLLSDQSQGPWTAGSFFKNPLVNEAQVNAIIGHEEAGVSREQLLRQNVIHGGDQTRVSAAHVLLAAGFRRGQTWGKVRLHPDHILKIENAGGATAHEIYDVVQEIINTVKQNLDITLEPEVRIIGF
ncbi:FAD-binding protein, partial [Candidatus Saccharibacteria bacterium]|nr:FAD-binding protein [Candidatus Saccharibacteria bacterium]